MTLTYTDGSISELIRAFEDATIAREAWRHADHLVVALYYLESGGIQRATEKMRAGILNLLSKGFGVDLKKEMPYHETITVFWIREVANFAETHRGKAFVDVANALVNSFDKDHPLKFYTRERLFSDEARASYVEPDIEAQAAAS